MKKNLTQKLIESHRVEGEIVPGQEIGIKIDQTLTQDATGTMVMLELEAMGLNRVVTDLSAQYVDHNLLQTDFKNADDHLFLQSACERYGIWFSRPGNGVSHPVHMERFGKPGATLLGSDSHTCAAGSLGMLAIGSGGLEVALAMAGEPFYVPMPYVCGVSLTGNLPPWVSAKDIILEMLRRRGVDGGLGRIFEYYGPGLDHLTAMDRHVIANMGAELGATTSVFPSDLQTLRFLRSQHREEDYQEMCADEGATYDDHEEVDLSALEPLIALPGSPGNVVPVKEVAGREIYQAYIGSSANPGLRDFAIPAMMVEGQRVHTSVSFDINPTSRQILENLMDLGHLQRLVHAGARIHQAGCNGCIGMGQAPATDRISLRTVPRNFPGRSGTREDQVYLCSPETAAASALTGKITDPRTLSMEYPKFEEPERIRLNTEALMPPGNPDSRPNLIQGPNIVPIPLFPALPDTLDIPVLLKVGGDISTDEIMPAGARVLPFRSNIPEISRFVFEGVDSTFYERAMDHQETGFCLVAGTNYGQGSSREHASLAPRFLGLRVVLARSFARIHRKNLINFGILPLTFIENSDYDRLDRGHRFRLTDLHRHVREGDRIEGKIEGKMSPLRLRIDLSPRERKTVMAGGLINLTRGAKTHPPSNPGKEES
ncbi:MAG TPA: aconitate hydratase [Thermoanaerobaculia bacterium]|nr:aconitate hydratase [Thermoanaerobaculia bacterium]HUM30608.1 aconitate hydratase [Thermoanaerobaculia bacterium]HXK68864.1 aconitate hydratase [Thermoanaerobaculia bacterium]